jgi:glycerol kinase
MRKDSDESLCELRVDGSPTRNAILMQLMSNLLGLMHVAQCKAISAH